MIIEALFSIPAVARAAVQERDERAHRARASRGLRRRVAAADDGHQVEHARGRLGEHRRVEDAAAFVVSEISRSRGADHAAPMTSATAARPPGCPFLE